MRSFKTLLLSLIMIQSANSQGIDSEQVRQKIRATGRADIVIYLKGHADLAGATKITNRIQRVTSVRNQLLATSDQAQAQLLRELTKNQVRFHRFYIENAVAVFGVTLSLFEKLALRPEVRFIQIDVSSRIQSFASRPIGVSEKVGTPSFIPALGIDKVWAQFGKGGGIVIAGEDSGFSWQHNALKKQYRGQSAGTVDHNYNWLDAVGISREPTDDTGHGTHTMGTMIGFDGGSARIGVAPQAQWIGCKNMKNGVGTVSSYLTCMEFLMAPYPMGGDARSQGRPDLAPHIVNNSWTCPTEEGCRGDEFLNAVRAFKAAGIFFVSAAGNQGPACGTLSRPPAFYVGDVFSVGSYNRYVDEVAFFSARGPSTWNGLIGPNLIALGDSVVSSDIGGPDKYSDRMGTSMASPQVAGVVALLWSARPELIGQIDRTIEILQKSASPVKSSESCGGVSGRAVPNSSAGYGILDAYAALKYH